MAKYPGNVVVRCPCGFTGTSQSVGAHRSKKPACRELGDPVPLQPHEMVGVGLQGDDAEVEAAGGGEAADGTPAPGEAVESPPVRRTPPPSASANGGIPPPPGLKSALPLAGKGPVLLQPDPPAATVTLKVSVKTLSYYDACRASWGYDKTLDLFIEECVDDLFCLLGWDVALIPREEEVVA